MIEHSRTRRFGDDDGITLIELLVSITLLAIVMTIVVGAFTQYSQSFSSARSSSDSTNVASVGMNEVTRVIRSGTQIERADASANLPPFITAKREEVRMYAYLDTDSLNPRPLMVEFRVDPTTRDLVERRWPTAGKDARGYWTFPSVTSAPSLQRVVARKLVAPVGTNAPLFTFLTTTGCPAANPTCTIVPASGNSLNAAEIHTIVAVQVTMKVQADDLKRAEPVVLTNRVGIPNLGISRVGL